MRGRVASARGNVRKGVGPAAAGLKERTIPLRAARAVEQAWRMRAHNRGRREITRGEDHISAFNDLVVGGRSQALRSEEGSQMPRHI